jgi:hypothetical protein
MKGSGASRQYLLYAGSQGARGGRSELVGAYEDEEAARAAFIAVRLERQRDEDWAQLAAVPAEGRVRMLCWFGESRPDVTGAPASEPRPEPVPPGAEPVPPRPAKLRARLLRRWRREGSD